MSHIYVTGHKIPDTDSIISAIIFSEYLNQKWIEAKAYRLWELNNETRYILEKVWISEPELLVNIESWSKMALVDHNEKSQTIDNIDELELEYIVDHHKIWNLSTNNPIFIRTEKVCSTNSVLFKMFKESNLVISKQYATLMLSAILSDSLGFRSPTTTPEDKIIVEELNEIAWISDLESFAMDMFKAKSDLWDISIEDLIKIDYKEFEFWSKKIWVWTVETTNPDYSLSRKNEIIEWMKKIKNEFSLDFIMLSIVDIINEKNITIIPGESESIVLNEVFSTKEENNLVDLWSRISRKKQIIPQLTEYFNK
ncbi:MAG: hypothetical protein ACD_4C00114G0004 [uncultured bacterium (gcode 4)]|uniref:inorganic diphosphatase n=1 Tax=uncultured bacterium (gcode 4) TaxID=1234023 RepID=K2FVE3_9BACT|nr:MAG: hypothetical protein ACD_4C00114G0004 [uncultured bacterium (gcode 4)]